MVVTIINCDLELNPQISGNDEAELQWEEHGSVPGRLSI